MAKPDEPWVVEAAARTVPTGETDASGSPEPVPDGFPRPRPAHVQVRAAIPEGDGGEPADHGTETQPGKAAEDHDAAHGEQGG